MKINYDKGLKLLLLLLSSLFLLLLLLLLLLLALPQIGSRMCNVKVKKTVHHQEILTSELILELFFFCT